MARILPCAADFDCYVNGELLPWNDEIGLRYRWQAANLAKTSFRKISEHKIYLTKEEAADLVTEDIRQELGNDSVTIKVKEQEP
jgi:hypothetical protein